MRLTLGLLLILLFPAFAADQYAPAGILRGHLESAPSALSGDLRVQTAEAVLLCRYDPGTWIERNGQRVAPAALKQGDPVEIVADRRASTPCYARMIRVSEVVKQTGTPPAGARARLRPPRPVVETWMPRGNLTFAGVVLRLNPELLILRNRDGSETHVVLRQDTRFVDSGLPAAFENLRPNTRVFIRGGRNLEQEVEAYQVAWGRIEGP